MSAAEASLCAQNDQKFVEWKQHIRRTVCKTAYTALVLIHLFRCTAIIFADATTSLPLTSCCSKLSSWRSRMGDGQAVGRLLFQPG